MGAEIIVGCDPHKQTLTLAAVDGLGQEIEVMTAGNDAGGDRRGARVAGRTRGGDRVGIEGSAGHGHQLAVALVEAGHDVREVPARRTAQRRRERRRPKTDRDDAVAIARATAAEPTLGPVRAGHQDPVIDELDAVTDWRDDLVDQRKRLLNQAEGVLNKLPVELLDRIGRVGKTISRARRALNLTSDDPVARTRMAHLADLVGRHDELTATINGVENGPSSAGAATGTTLREEVGIDWIGAARLLVEIGDPTRFRTESRLRPLVRHRRGRHFLRRRRQLPHTPPTRPRRQPTRQLGAAHRLGRPRTPPPRRPRLHRPQTTRRQDQPRSPPRPQTPSRRPRHPTPLERRSPTTSPRRMTPLDKGATDPAVRVAELLRLADCAASPIRLSPVRAAPPGGLRSVAHGWT